MRARKPMAQSGREVAARIRASAERSRKNRDKYTETQVRALERELARAGEEVQRELRRFGDLVSPTAGQAVRLKHLRALKDNIGGIAADLAKHWSALTPNSVEGAVKLGVRDGVEDMADVGVEGYAKLTLAEKDALAARMFAQVDRQSVDFLVRFQVELVGEVAADMKIAIKSQVSAGIVAGKGIPDISRDIGEVITDKDTFRKAGRTVFKSAQYRVEMIARTETLRAHNQGRLKFYEMAGVGKVQWLATMDERTAPLDRSYHGRVFAIGEVPELPLHPNCRCTVVSVVGV